MKKTEIMMVMAAMAAILMTCESRAQATPPPDEPPPHLWSNSGEWLGGHFAVCLEPAEKFRSGEFSVDMFGSFVAPEHGFTSIFNTSIHHGTWGGGVGANYFFTRMFGLTGDLNIPNNGGNFVDNVSMSLVFRLPWQRAGLAPYIFGGGGHNTDQNWDWTEHVGVGLEFRFNPITSLFVDGRYVWADSPTDIAQLRAGLRFVF